MVSIRPTGDVLGATITGIDLSRAMSDGEFSTILQALGEHGVLRFPDQLLEPAALRDFSMRFEASKPRSPASSRIRMCRRSASSRTSWRMGSRLA